MARILFIVQENVEHLGVLYISSCLKKAGHQVRMAITSIGMDPVAISKEFNPDILAYSIHTGTHHSYLQLNQHIRQYINALSVFGGPHATFFPEIIKRDKVDAICIGEGEEAMVDLANSIDSGRVDSHIPNWHFKINGEIIKNKVRPFADIELLPSPDRKLAYEISKAQQYNFAKSFMTSRGCPYGCTYCFNEGLFKIYGEKKIRQQSVDKTIEEINAVRKDYPLPSLIFYDDTFCMNRRWLIEFAEKYPREVGIPFQCFIRPELVTPEIAKLLKKAGCAGASLGIEAGNEHVRREILNRKMSNEQIIDACKILKSYGLKVTCFIMLGLPTTTLKDDIQTVKVSSKCRPDLLSAFIYQPYPGTPLGEFCFQKNLVTGTVDDIPLGFKSRTILKMSARQKRQVENLRNFAGITAAAPWLLPIVRLLIELPQNRYYRKLSELWWNYSITRRVHKIPLNWRQKRRR